MQKTEKFYFGEIELSLLNEGGNKFKRGLGCQTWQDAKHLIKYLKSNEFAVTHRTVRDRVRPYIFVKGIKLPAKLGKQLPLFRTNVSKAS